MVPSIEESVGSYDSVTDNAPTLATSSCSGDPGQPLAVSGTLDEEIPPYSTVVVNPQLSSSGNASQASVVVDDSVELNENPILHLAQNVPPFVGHGLNSEITKTQGASVSLSVLWFKILTHSLHVIGAVIYY